LAPILGCGLRQVNERESERESRESRSVVSVVGQKGGTCQESHLNTPPSPYSILTTYSGKKIAVAGNGGRSVGCGK
jgi:hypothetical protein